MDHSTSGNPIQSALLIYQYTQGNEDRRQAQLRIPWTEDVSWPPFRPDAHDPGLHVRHPVAGEDDPERRPGVDYEVDHQHPAKHSGQVCQSRIALPPDCSTRV